MNNKARILLVEDETNFGSMLKSYLELNDFEVVHAMNGREGWTVFRNGPFDLCILDVMMPEKDGFSLAREIRDTGSEVPVIFLTAKTLREDILKGFRAGGDDYITKPFDSEILIARIKAILRRKGGENRDAANERDCYDIGKYSFYPRIRVLRYENSERTLTSREAELLEMLCASREDILLRKDALTRIWGDDNYFNTRSMDVFIARLRKYFKDDPDVEIMNVHSQGFRMIIHKEHPG